MTMRNQLLLVTSIIGLLALSGVSSATGAETPGYASPAPRTVVLLPTRAHVVKVGMKLQPSDEWTAAAGAAVDSALRAVVGQSPLLSVRELPSLTPDEDAAIDEFLAVATRVQMQGYDQGAKGITRALRAYIDRSIGSSLSFLQARAGADYALVTLGFQAEQSDGMVALSGAGALASVLFPPVLVLPTSTLSYAALFLVELRTGQVRWCNGRIGREVGGYNFTDLRDPESATKVITALFRPYPKIPEGLEGQVEPAVAPGDLSMTPGGLTKETVSPPVGDFALRTPVGWRVQTDTRKSVVTATRDGRLLNELKVQLRRHSQAFPETGQKSTRNASPDQLAQWYATELQGQKLDDLEISEISVNAELAGRAAFRMLFSYRLPTEWGGARMAQVTIGAATPRGLLLSELSAPKFFYFQKSLPAFEESIRTVTLEPRMSRR